MHQFLSSIWLPGAQVVHRLALAPAHQCEGRSHPFCISPLSHLINWVTKMPMECIMQDPHHQHTQSFLNSFLFSLRLSLLLSPSLSLASSGCVPPAHLHILDIHDRHGRREKKLRGRNMKNYLTIIMILMIKLITPWDSEMDG